jgi:2-keto-4-pentenoate hydratase/2-oxohepta-3-ene-1,7-dioic acid hydratase in catechol pathway
MPLRFFAYQTSSRGGIGVENAGKLVDLGQLLGAPFDQADLVPVIQGGFFDAGELADVEELVTRRGDRAPMPSDWKWALPIRRPDKVLAMARNYRAHAEEFKNEVPAEPVFFAKLAQCLVANDAPVVIPSWLTTRVDHEVELAVIIGTPGRNVSAGSAMQHVAGYSILNDVSARNMQGEDIQNRRPWLRSKSLDTFGPFGPYVVPAASVPDPHALDISLNVNGETRQKSNTSQMVHQIPAVIAYVSLYTTLLPGDVIAMGTPEGVGPVKHGDVMEATITGLGTLRSPVKQG